MKRHYGKTGVYYNTPHFMRCGYTFFPKKDSLGFSSHRLNGTLFRSKYGRVVLKKKNNFTTVDKHLDCFLSNLFLSVLKSYTVFDSFYLNQKVLFKLNKMIFRVTSFYLFKPSVQTLYPRTLGFRVLLTNQNEDGII